METNNNATNNIEPGISVWTEEDDKITRVEFTAEMKKDYKILLPTMLPRHMKMIASLLKVYGYDAEMLENTGQKVIDTGLYSIVRHPMYSATIFLFLSMPLVLGSIYSFLIFLAYPFIIVMRIKSEEEFLEKELDGYREYMQKVKYRLIPFVW